MIPAQRHALILQHLSKKDVLSIAELSHILGVSRMTIRRDIRSLEEQGRALSVVGGVQLPERIFSEPSHMAKRSLFLAQKQAIGRVAARMIKSGTVIYLDAGTTTLEIAHLLVGRQDITVITNDFVIASFLSQESSCRLFHTGGEIERANQSCVGVTVADAIQRFNFDLAFLSTSSFGPRGISTPFESKIAVKRAVVESAACRVLVTDSSKYGLIGTFNIIPLDQLSAIVTDNDLSESARETIMQCGVALHLA